jgi:drug/metabolite transporter (DMT)-like permease
MRDTTLPAVSETMACSLVWPGGVLHTATMKSPAAKDSRLFGILLVISAVTVFAGTDAVSKLLVEKQTISQTLHTRFIFAVPFLLAVTPVGQWRNLLRTPHPFLQFLRGAAPVIVSLAMVIGLKFLPLADTTVVAFSAPFLVLAFSGLVLGERVGLWAWVGVTLGFIGVLAVARPGSAGFSPYLIFPAAGALFYAAFIFISRRLAAAGDAATTTLAWTLMVGTVATVPMVVLDWKPVTTTGVLLGLASGATFFCGQYLMTKAFEYAPANVLAPFTYFQILAAAGLGILLFGELPDQWTWIGIAVICVSGLIIASADDKGAGTKQPAA